MRVSRAGYGRSTVARLSDLFLREMRLRKVRVMSLFVRVLDAVVSWLMGETVDAVDEVDEVGVPSLGVCLRNVCVVSVAMSSLALVPLVIG